MILSVRRDACIACHRCTHDFPNLLRPDGEGLATPVRRVIGERERDAVLLALEGCPVSAIEVERGASAIDISPAPG